MSEEQLAGGFTRAASFAIAHIDGNQKSYLKRLKESELADLNKLVKKLEIQLESFSRRCTSIYLPKDLQRLIDMMTTFGVTLMQVELHLQRQDKNSSALRKPIYEESALEEFESDLNLQRGNDSAQSHYYHSNLPHAAKRKSQAAALREWYNNENANK